MVDLNGGLTQAGTTLNTIATTRDALPIGCVAGGVIAVTPGRSIVLLLVIAGIFLALFIYRRRVQAIEEMQDQVPLGRRSQRSRATQAEQHDIDVGDVPLEDVGVSADCRGRYELQLALEEDSEGGIVEAEGIQKDSGYMRLISRSQST